MLNIEPFSTVSANITAWMQFIPITDIIKMIRKKKKNGFDLIER